MYLKEILRLMKQAIETEQSTQRNKVLSPGLSKAVEIVNQFIGSEDWEYEYQLNDGKWQHAKPENIKMFVELGFNIRRKK